MCSSWLISLALRKEDLTEGGKKSTNRKWREWSVVLTRSQLLFFRDLTFAARLIGRPAGEMYAPAAETGLLHPDELVSLHECIAVFDTAYTKACYEQPHNDYLYADSVLVCTHVPILYA